MKRKRFLLVLTGLVVLVVAPISMAMFLEQHLRDPIRCENFRYLKTGMTKAEVEALIGCPPGNYRTAAFKASWAGGPFIQLSNSSTHWQSDEHDVTIYWDENDRYLAGAVCNHATRKVAIMGDWAGNGSGGCNHINLLSRLERFVWSSDD